MKVQKHLSTVFKVLFGAVLFSCAQHTRAFEISASATDSVYDQSVRSILFFPETGVENMELVQPIVNINSRTPLRLEFDVLGPSFDDYYAKLLYRNYDWTPSTLRDIEFIEEYNEFPLTFYQASFNTRIDYTHFTYTVPAVKKAGNYTLVIYRNQDFDDIVLTRRFCVYNEKLKIDIDESVIAGVGATTGEQRINFDINTQSAGLINPSSNLHVNIRKNNRWNTLRTNLQPTYISPGDAELKYRGITGDYLFNGGNEYRKFDSRSTQFAGFNVARVQNQDSLFQIALVTDALKVSDNYININDINGQYVIDHYEYGEGQVNADYVKTYFSLESPYKQVGDVYIYGALTDWKLQERFKMNYFAQEHLYFCNVLLKQGYYNYDYVILRPEKKIDEYFISGNHFATENEYEVFVYYTPPGQRENLLIGYTSYVINEK